MAKKGAMSSGTGASRSKQHDAEMAKHLPPSPATWNRHANQWPYHANHGTRHVKVGARITTR